MSKNLKAASLAAAIALAMGSTAAWGATAPTATQLPGKGVVVTGPSTVSVGTITSGEQTINITGNAVINWGASGATINTTQPGGFNVGSTAKLHFAGSGTNPAVLNIDSSGNPSQIMGTIDTGTTPTNTSIFVANSNGIIVGKGASINAGSGKLGLIANTGVNTDLFAATGAVPTYDGAGGDVTVSGSLTGSTVLVSGGGTVNVDLAQIATTTSSTLQAGIHTSTTSGSKDNPAATLNLSNSGESSYSAKGGDVIASAGNITTAGTLDLSAIDSADDSTGSLRVGGSLTNTGNLTVATVGGAVVNQNTLTVKDGGTLGGLTNAGEATLGGALKVTGGDLVNQGKITGATGGSAITVTDGNLNNSGLLSGVTSLATASDADFTAGADYSITNSGAIEAAGTGTLALNANANSRPPVDTTGKVKNDTTGSIANTGNIYLGAATGLTATAYNDLTLGGLLFAGATPVPVTSDDAWAGAVSLVANGALTVTAPIYVTTGDVKLAGSVVRAMADVSSATGNVAITAGGAVDGDYAVRVAKGATVSGASVTVAGNTADGSQLYPNVILQGTVAGNKINFTNVSDVFSGPAGGLLVTGTNPTVGFDFTGRIKTAPYLNASNFRYNYLPIDFGKGVTKVGLTLNPVTYKTNGTDNGKAAVNILVNGDVNLSQTYATSSVNPNGTAVTGVNPVANTHLVLQSTGDISTGTGAFYWPGYVYLGTVDADADGNALPGTLGLGSISLGSQFSNVLPGDVSGASGIHFMTQLPLTLASSTKILTNANAWVNFPTDALTQLYVAMNAKSPFVYSGQTSANSKVVTYLPADGSVFHTHPVDSSK